ncbi:hypothetical protein PMAN_a2479 [Pseudoalteromonas marina]|nr:hypothetical protein PMAN_a2479 [Pseudoalteromonas marina]GAA75855.1 hypothetical protein P20480_2327 [Pseudoalteromonas sp. BSi20480]
MPYKNYLLSVSYSINLYFNLFLKCNPLFLIVVFIGMIQATSNS